MKHTTQLRLNLITAICGAGLALLAPCAWADLSTAPVAGYEAKTKTKTTWVTAARKHNGSGVTMSYSVPKVLNAGQMATVQIRLSNVKKTDASVKVTPPASVTLTGNTSVVTGMALPLGSTTVTLQVTPSVDGLEYLNVFTTQGGRTSVQAIPLQVGSAPPALKTQNKIETTPDGEKVISLPAQ
jgi:hypothetical protein